MSDVSHEPNQIDRRKAAPAAGDAPYTGPERRKSPRDDFGSSAKAAGTPKTGVS